MINSYRIFKFVCLSLMIMAFVVSLLTANWAAVAGWGVAIIFAFDSLKGI